MQLFLGDFGSGLLGRQAENCSFALTRPTFLESNLSGGARPSKLEEFLCPQEARLQSGETKGLT